MVGAGGAQPDIGMAAEQGAVGGGAAAFDFEPTTGMTTRPFNAYRQQGARGRYYWSSLETGVFGLTAPCCTNIMWVLLEIRGFSLISPMKLTSCAVPLEQ